MQRRLRRWSQRGRAWGRRGLWRGRRRRCRLWDVRAIKAAESKGDVSRGKDLVDKIGDNGAEDWRRLCTGALHRREHADRRRVESDNHLPVRDVVEALAEKEGYVLLEGEAQRGVAEAAPPKLDN